MKRQAMVGNILQGIHFARRKRTPQELQEFDTWADIVTDQE